MQWTRVVVEVVAMVAIQEVGEFQEVAAVPVAVAAPTAVELVAEWVAAVLVVDLQEAEAVIPVEGVVSEFVTTVTMVELQAVML